MRLSSSSRRRRTIKRTLAFILCSLALTGCVAKEAKQPGDGRNDGGASRPDAAPNPDLDLDQDGYPPIDGDCDDTNPEIGPQATEICDDGIDQDCDGVDDVEVLGVYLEQLRFNRRSEKSAKTLRAHSTGIVSFVSGRLDSVDLLRLFSASSSAKKTSPSCLLSLRMRRTKASTV